MDIFNKKNCIEKLLTDHLALRDNDYRLAANVWAMELKQLGYSKDRFLEAYAHGKLTTAESIYRCRRKLQEDNPKLRGNNWSQRQTRAKKVRKEIVDVNFS